MYLNGIIQGDLLSLILFVLSMNPLLFLLHKCEVYLIGTIFERETKLNHLFFVDSLKLFDKNIYTAKQLLDIVTTFSKDINMQFRVDKCAYIYNERGNWISLRETMNIDGIEIKGLEEGDT